MAKVTSKLQVTIPKRLATSHGIAPGDQVTWEDGGEVLRIRPAAAKSTSDNDTVRERLRLFDTATRRQGERDAQTDRQTSPPDRGWTREELYDRAGPR